MRMAIAQKRFIGEFRVGESLFFIFFYSFLYIYKNMSVTHIKSFLIFTFSLEISTEEDSFLRIGSKRRRIALSSYIPFCTVYPKRELTIVCNECTFIRRIFSTQEPRSRAASDLSLRTRGIVFSVPRDNRHYPDTLWFSAENKPTAVSAACREYATRSRQERKVSTVDRADDDDDARERERKREAQLYTIGERTTKLILFSALTHPSAIFRSPSTRFNGICAPSVSPIRLE